jgi:Heterokaryon incompatibility protein (HET)
VPKFHKISVPRSTNTLAMAEYVYTPVNSAKSEIRLLKLPFSMKRCFGRRSPEPLRGTLTNYFLPSDELRRRERFRRTVHLPVYDALSYVWGDPSRTHEIWIEGRVLKITASLHGALTQLVDFAQTDQCIWADAICINQDDLEERSAQVLLIRQIYHFASIVNISLGLWSSETDRALRFLIELTNGVVNTRPDPQDESGDLIKEEDIERFMFSVIQKPLEGALRGSMTFLKYALFGVEALNPGMRDDRATMVMDADEWESLVAEEMKGLLKWKPRAKDIKKLEREKDWVEVAKLIDEFIITGSDWFSRMWVVQEAVASVMIYIHQGDQNIYWPKFLQGVIFLHYQCNAPIKNIEKVIALGKMNTLWDSGKRLPLIDLIRECRYRKATDPRDKIYSLHGVMGDRMNDFLKPDYAKPVNEVYSNATLHFIAQAKKLNPICGWQLAGRRGDLPSWVPDFRLDQDEAASPFLPAARLKSIYAASGYDFHGEYQIPNPPITSGSWAILPVQGFCIGVIASVSEACDTGASFGEREKNWLECLSKAPQLTENISTDELSSLTQLSDLVTQYSEYSYSAVTPSNSEGTTATPEPPTAELSASSGIHPGKLTEAYLRTLLCDRLSEKERLTEQDMAAILTSSPAAAARTAPSVPKQGKAKKKNKLPIPEALAPAPAIIDKVAAAFAAGINFRRLAVTEKGALGAVPETAMVGDLVCVLWGCDVPVLLRKGGCSGTGVGVGDGSDDDAGKKGSENGKDREDYCEFAGECYMHGFMDGEAIALFVRGDMELQEFELR